MTLRTVSLVLVLGIALPGLPARGAGTSAAGLLEDGIYQYSIAEFERSIELLERARKLTDDAALLGKIQLYLGVNHAVMGKRRRARAAFRQALTHAPELTLDPAKFKSRVVELLEQVRHKMTGQLKVTSPVPGARVLVDGKPAGEVPYSARLTVGAYQVEVRGPDGKIITAQQAVVRHRAETVVQATPQPAPAARPAAPPPLPPAAVARPAPQADRPPQKRGRLWTWIAAGGAVAAGAVGLGVGLSARKDYDEYESMPWDEQAILDQERTIRRKSLVANISFAAAGALAVTSVVLFFVEGGSSEQRAAVLPTAGPGGAGLMLQGGF